MLVIIAVTHTIDRYNEIAIKVAKDSGVIINDINKLTRNLASDCYKDYCHFAEEFCAFRKNSCG